MTKKFVLIFTLLFASLAWAGPKGDWLYSIVRSNNLKKVVVAENYYPIEVHLADPTLPVIYLVYKSDRTTIKYFRVAESQQNDEFTVDYWGDAESTFAVLKGKMRDENGYYEYVRESP